METRTYLRIFLVLAALALLLVDPWLYLLEEWDVETFSSYVVSDAPVVFMGDSVVFSPGHCDRDRRTIAEITEDLTGVKVFPFTHAAFSPIVYRKAAPLLARLNSDTRLAVMPINLGNFSPGFMNPVYRFPRRQLAYDLMSLHLDVGTYFQLRFRNREQAWLREWYDQSVHDDTIDLGDIGSINRRLRKLKPINCDTSYDGQQDLVKLRLAFHYGNRITRDHPMIRYIQESLDRFERHNVRVLPYLTPVDMEAIDALAGEPLAGRVRENLALLREIGRERGWGLLDLSGVLPDKDFGERHCACGHLQAEGRRKVAQAVSAEMMRLLGTQSGARVAGDGR